ncbi:MAG: Lpp/OprI family alanine-zipper lipoprotein [Methylococcales bacterium]|nr:Lpp/OprI family alanine-zipper lipoprotein [Methylococcales bacterium]
MKKFTTLSVIALVSTLFVGCATNSDIENLQSQIDALNSKVTTVAADASSAKNAAADASARASAAEAAANRAAGYARDTNDKLDRMFKQSMMK